MKKSAQRFSNQELLQIARLHRQASIMFWVAFAYPILLVLLYDFGLFQLWPEAFLTCIPVLFITAWLQYMRLRTRLGYPIYEQVLITLPCILFPPIALIWLFDAEHITVRLFRSHGLNYSALGFSKNTLLKLDAQVCFECMYDMHGLDNATVCPECGTPYQRPDLAQPDEATRISFS